MCPGRRNPTLAITAAAATALVLNLTRRRSTQRRTERLRSGWVGVVGLYLEKYI
jgi:hypothetical protein